MDGVSVGSYKQKETPTPNNGSERNDLDGLIERIKQSDEQTIELIRRIVGYQ